MIASMARRVGLTPTLVGDPRASYGWKHALGCPSHW